MAGARGVGAVAREPGVAEKLLGVFGERRLELGCLRLDAGAVHAMPSRPGARLIVVLAGAVRADGVELGLQGAAQLAAGECARIAAPAAAEVLVVGLPIFGA